ncbi:MAG: hypothetical protein AB7S26_02950 [Sandaracinaceae bacterium]
MRNWAGWLAAIAILGACDGDGDGGGDGGSRRDGGVVQPPSDECGPVRLTNYTLGESGWCEIRHDIAQLPAFVRDQRQTAAIAEPFNGSSYGGEPGESCGECWEVTSATATTVVMITDLCPIMGNEPCNGAVFHLDISSEASQVLNAGFFDMGAARRVPCPVEGNIHVVVNDENVSYMRLAFIDQRIPIRSASVQAVDGSGAALGAPVELSRSGGAWEAISDMPLDRGGAGVVFTLTSATGQTVESSVVVPAHPSHGEVFDLGVQVDAESSGGTCQFAAPGDVYVDQWGGIEGVRWSINPWGEAESGFHGEVTDGCFAGSSCVRLDTLGQYAGFHVTYPMHFPTSSFSRLTMQLSADIAGQLNVMPSIEGERCDMTVVDVGPGFTEVSIDVAAVCGGRAELNGFTVDNPGPRMALTLDDVRFVP